jgi:hypothetical protein
MQMTTTQAGLKVETAAGPFSASQPLLQTISPPGAQFLASTSWKTWLRRDRRVRLESLPARCLRQRATPSLHRKQPRWGSLARAVGKESSNDCISTEPRKALSERPMKPGPARSSADEDKQDLVSKGKEGDVSAQQRAALQSLDAQLSRLSDKDAGQLNPRRRFAEDLARKTGENVKSLS